MTSAVANESAEGTLFPSVANVHGLPQVPMNDATYITEHRITDLAQYLAFAIASARPTDIASFSRAWLQNLAAQATAVGVAPRLDGVNFAAVFAQPTSDAAAARGARQAHAKHANPIADRICKRMDRMTEHQLLMLAEAAERIVQHTRKNTLGPKSDGRGAPDGRNGPSGGNEPRPLRRHQSAVFDQRGGGVGALLDLGNIPSPRLADNSPTRVAMTTKNAMMLKSMTELVQATPPTATPGITPSQGSKPTRPLQLPSRAADRGAEDAATMKSSNSLSGHGVDGAYAGGDRRRVAISAAPPDIADMMEAAAPDAKPSMDAIEEVPKSVEEVSKLKDALRLCTLFVAFEEDNTIDPVVKAMRPESFEAGVDILSQGKPGRDTFFLIVSGTADVVKSGKVVASLTPGRYFGELELLQGNADNVCAATVRSTTTLKTYTLNRATYQQLLLKNNYEHRRMFEQLVRQVAVFEPLSNYDKMIVAEAIKTKRLKPDEFLIRSGGDVATIYIIISGTVKVIRLINGVSTEVARLGPGSVVGEIEFLFGHPAVADVIATDDDPKGGDNGPGVRVGLISRLHLEKCVASSLVSLRQHFVTLPGYEAYIAHASPEVRLQLEQSARRGYKSVRQVPTNTHNSGGPAKLTSKASFHSSTFQSQATAGGEFVQSWNGADPSSVRSNLIPGLSRMGIEADSAVSYPTPSENDPLSIRAGGGGVAPTFRRQPSMVRHPSMTTDVDDDGEMMWASGGHLYRFPVRCLIPEGILLAGLQEDGSILYWGDGMVRVTGYESQDVSGRSIFTLLDEESQTKCLSLLEGARTHVGDYPAFVANGLSKRVHLQFTAKLKHVTTVSLVATMVPPLYAQRSDVPDTILFVAHVRGTHDSDAGDGSTPGAAARQGAEGASSAFSKWFLEAFHDPFYSAMRVTESFGRAKTPLERSAVTGSMLKEPQPLVQRKSNDSSPLFLQAEQSSRLNFGRGSGLDVIGEMSVGPELRVSPADATTLPGSAGYDQVLSRWRTVESIVKQFEPITNLSAASVETWTACDVRMILRKIQTELVQTCVQSHNRLSTKCGDEIPSGTIFVDGESLYAAMEAAVLQLCQRAKCVAINVSVAVSKGAPKEAKHGASAQDTGAAEAAMLKPGLYKMQVLVTDDGPGFSEPVMEEFKQNPTSSSNLPVLSAVINKLRKSNGDIVISNMKGGVVDVTLPFVVSNSRPSDPLSGPAITQVLGRTLSTVLVESDAIDRNMFCQFLWNRKHAVLPASSWSDVNTLISSNPIDILIIDPSCVVDEAMSQSGTWIDPMEKLREAARRVVIIVTSASFDDDSIEDFNRTGLLALAKPFPLAKLHMLVERAEALIAEKRKQELNVAQMKETLAKAHHGAWTKGRQLGKGAFGEVFEAIDTKTGGKMAVKILKVTADNESRIQATMNEISTMITMQHDNIIQYFHCELARAAETSMEDPSPSIGHVSNESLSTSTQLMPSTSMSNQTASHSNMKKKSNLAGLLGTGNADDESIGADGKSITGELKVFMELAPGGTLQEKVKEIGAGLSIQDIIKYTSDVVQGIAFIHEHRYVHGDIKTANVLLGADGRCKIADFGSATLLPENRDPQGPKPMLYEMHGTPLYMAPEVLNADREEGQGYDFKADIWSLGCVVMEMATGKSPFSFIGNPISVMRYVSELSDNPDLSPLFHCHPSLFLFVERCLTFDCEKRATASELLRLPLLNGVEVDSSAIKVLRRAEYLHRLNQFVAFKEPDEPHRHHHHHGASKDGGADFPAASSEGSTSDSDVGMPMGSLAKDFFDSDDEDDDDDEDDSDASDTGKKKPAATRPPAAVGKRDAAAMSGTANPDEVARMMHSDASSSASMNPLHFMDSFRGQTQKRRAWAVPTGRSEGAESDFAAVDWDAFAKVA